MERCINILSFVTRCFLASAVMAGTTVMLVAVASAQEPGSEEEAGALAWADRVVSGSVGFAGEFYGVSGIPARRPATSLRVYTNTSFDLYGLQSGLNLTYSTESNELRQSMNRISFGTRWSWGRVQAGAVSPSLSAYSLNGETARGGFVELTPGPVVVSLAAGRTQRAVTPAGSAGFRQPAFERWLYAGRLGFGDEDGTHFHLVGLYARDDTSSLAGVGEAALPKENVSFTPVLGLSLFDDAFSLEAQVTASALTRDTRAGALDLDDTPVPGFVTSAFTPRTSTFVSWAGQAATELDLQRGGLRVGYERIEPGFRSLGRPQLRSDQETIRVEPRLRLFQGRLSLSGQIERRRNNLLGQKVSTLRHRRYGLNVQARPWQMLSVSGSFQQLTSDNQPVADADPEARRLSLHHVIRTFTLAPTLTVRAGPTTHNVSLSGSLQRADRNRTAPADGAGAVAQDPGSQSLTTTLAYTLALPSGLSANASGNYVSNDAGRSETRVVGLTAGAGYALFDGRLRFNADAGFSMTTNALQPVGSEPGTGTTRTSRQLRSSLNGTYRLWDQGTLRVSVRGLRNSSDRYAFTEMRGTLRFEHRF